MNVLDQVSLRNAAARNAAMGGELFRVFFESAQDCVTHMQANIETGNHHRWQRTAQAFNDLSRNLGAVSLGELCLKAQHLEAGDEAAKIYTLMNIRRALHELAAELWDGRLEDRN